METDFSIVNWFELEDGDFLCLQQKAVDHGERHEELDEIVMTRESAIELAYKILETLDFNR